MIHKEGAIILGICAVLAAAVIWLANSGGPCALYETREIEMTHQGKFNSGTRMHRVKVCVERVPAKE